MNIDILSALTIFAFVSSITPGPNNLMLMNSGANYGFKKTTPHLLGVGIGFTLMIALVGLGVIQLFDRFPVSYQILKVVSIVYLLYLAFKIASSTSHVEQQTSNHKPFSFIQAVLFQWVNPKAWTMALTSISLYAPSKSFTSVLLVAIVFGLINLPCISSWVVLGQKIQVLLTNQKRLRVFNITMALLLVISLYPAL
ncbi:MULTISPECIES: LysE family translocator [unclassified Colwellia]|jgi:threonine/homoserine/homoserine lactone efflux protein|uniref:LysE family translocator n=1 Tax=unclassified Colwellia TaxID=196834 RepID=UPI0015F3A732|nr:MULTISPECIES: LysE family translocator [unclassified Colwellia]MBA6339182.1 LysE family translocator [Colwellia sp. BRX8-7]MBA6353744.1 LysE family translocator [Colwellia sp. BRX9-1]MBA6357811.1 LysE family translocator [Colwellia sp. BRX8-3]MBA6361605.1 LysE family translocator [Colwellia sp. BRX8-6]MBA6369613.1 LysE family translocator [Colwellia sp. BRX8-5]|tara:strand:+ start:2024 stop:2614 length:591 start_codon:yes stop_codon:yes gene_type:complete